MDTDTLLIVACGPAWAIVNIAVAKYALSMFQSQQQLQTDVTATPPVK